MTGQPKPIATTRRQALAAGGVAIAGFAAGCSTVREIMGFGGGQADWPQFQYDAGNTGFTPADGPTAGVTTKWSVETDSVQMAWPPAIVDGTMYIPERNDRLLALNAGTGEERWRKEGLGILSGPAIGDGRVYIGRSTGTGEGEDHVVAAYNMETGEEEWTAEMAGRNVMPPTLADGTLYAGGLDHHLYAFDATTGDQRWRYEFNGQVNATPAVVNGSVFLGGTFDVRGPRQGPPRLASLDSSTGEEEWRVEFSQDQPALLIGGPTVGNASVYIQGKKIYAFDAETGRERWVLDRDNSSIESMALADGTLYVPGSGLVARDVETGEKRWSLDSDTIPPPKSPAVTEDTVYTTAIDGRLYAVATDSGEVRWNAPLDLPPEGRDSFGIGGGTPPAVTDGTLYAGGHLGTIYAFEEL